MMNKSDLKDSVINLDESVKRNSQRVFAPDQGIRQFNALLSLAKQLYLQRVDIQAIQPFLRNGKDDTAVSTPEFSDAVLRLRHAVEMRPTTSNAEILDSIPLPPPIVNDLQGDLTELRGAIENGLAKSALLLSGSIAEALLLHRFPDDNERGPGMERLVNRAKKELALGRDTRRALETLTDYRDLIHPRAEKRNRTPRDPVRVETAVNALKLLCLELEDEATER